MKEQKKFSLQGVRHVCGSYFNMALNNYCRTLNGVFIKCKIKFALKEDDFPRSLSSLRKIFSSGPIMPQTEKKVAKMIASVDTAMKLKQQLFKHFPMLGPIMDKTISCMNHHKGSSVADAPLDLCMNAILNFGECLYHCRNFYTHFKPYNSPEDLKLQYDIQHIIALNLGTLFDVSRRIGKKREGLTPEELEFLTGKNRFNQVGKKFLERNDWYLKIEKPSDMKDYDKTILSDFGMVYLCSIFLAKNYALRLFDESKLFNKETIRNLFSEEQVRFLKEMLVIYRIRTPRGKQLDSHDSKQALAMDMLNELRKCPRPLYDVLSEEYKKRTFYVPVEHENEKTEEYVKMLRSDDRFPYFTLRYIDDMEKFSRIRFQIRLGSYRFKFYDKMNIDGTPRIRSLQKEINGFGRLSDMENKRKREWKDMFQATEEIDYEDQFGDYQTGVTQFVEDTADTKPYVTNHRAAYNVHSNHIGLIWNDADSIILQDDNKLFFPDLKIDENGKADIYQPSPKASLSVFDFPAMVFYMYLREKTEATKEFPSAEQLIINKYDHLVRFFKDISDGRFGPSENKNAFSKKLKEEYDLKTGEIPEKLLHWLSSESEEDPSEKYAKKLEEEIKLRRERVQRRLEKFNQDLREIRKKDSVPYGKKGHVNIRHSQLAKYLMRSIMEWQPTRNDGKNKLTGQNFNVMTAFLATLGYTSQVKDLRDLFSRANMLEGPNAHPFLKKVLNNNSIKDIQGFYRTYLVEELNQIEDKQRRIAKAKNVKDTVRQFPFAHFNRMRYQKRDEDYYRNLAKRYLNIGDNEKDKAVILLPDGMFTSYIYDLIMKLPENNEKMRINLASDVAHCNSSFLISRFFENIRNDYAQPFYREERTYELFSILNNKKVRNTLQPLFISPHDINIQLTEKEKDGKGRLILQKIDHFCKSITQKGNFNNVEEAKEATSRKLKHLITDCKNNERDIRRYKTQDMVIYLMARDILKDIIPDSEKDKYAKDRKLLLKDVCEEGFLRQAVKMEYEYSIEEKGKRTRTVKITHPNMSLKNYGEFHRLLNDERLKSLLQQLANMDEIDYTDLMGEFADYDQKRSEIFRLAQSIEKHLYEQNEQGLNDEKSDLFYHTRYNGKKIPRRNSFSSLLELIGEEESQMTETDKKQTISIRNAFGHNTYKVSLAEMNATELPNVAKTILKKMEELRNKL